jgi:hypothetical protein
MKLLVTGLLIISFTWTFSALAIRKERVEEMAESRAIDAANARTFGSQNSNRSYNENGETGHHDCSRLLLVDLSGHYILEDDRRHRSMIELRRIGDGGYLIHSARPTLKYFKATELEFQRTHSYWSYRNSDHPATNYRALNLNSNAGQNLEFNFIGDIAGEDREHILKATLGYQKGSIVGSILNPQQLFLLLNFSHLTLTRFEINLAMQTLLSQELKSFLDDNANPDEANKWTFVIDTATPMLAAEVAEILGLGTGMAVSQDEGPSNRFFLPYMDRWTFLLNINKWLERWQVQRFDIQNNSSLPIPKNHECSIICGRVPDKN